MDCYWREVLHPVEAGGGRAGPEWPPSSGSGVLTSICSQPEVGLYRVILKKGYDQKPPMNYDSKLMRMIQTSVQPS